MGRLPDLDAIQAFLLVAEDLSFRRAAERLSLDQSVVSRRIKELETRLGVALLYRTTRAVRITEAGQAFYEANVELVRGLGDSISLARRAAKGLSGRLRIGYMSFAAISAMPEPVRRFRTAYPGVAVELTYLRTEAQKIELARGGIDVGFMLGPCERRELRAVQVLEERLVALLPSSNPLARNRPMTLADLAATPLVLGTMAQWDFYREILDAAFAEHGLTATAAFEASDALGMLGLVTAGLGATILPAGIGLLRPRGIEMVEIADCAHPVQTVLAWRGDNDSAAVGNFLKIAGAA